MINIAIVEDEEQMSNQLSECIEKFFKETDCFPIIEKYNNGNNFLNNFDMQYDLIFMDINLIDSNGIEIAKKIREKDDKVLLVFVTSLSNYALEGYKVNAFDYILKPITYFTFSLSMKRIYHNLSLSKDENVVITNRQMMKKIPIISIKYIEVNNHKLIFHTEEGVFESSSGTLKNYAEMFKKYFFVLCNSCYLVNLKFVSSVSKTQLMIGEDTLSISRPKRKEFLAELNKYYAKGVSYYGN